MRKLAERTKLIVLEAPALQANSLQMQMPKTTADEVVPANFQGTVKMLLGGWAAADSCNA